MDKQINISIIIPHFNGLDILKDCLNSLYKNTFSEFETILIDNGSTDGSQEFVAKNYPQVKIIQNVENLGYAGACNQGIRITKTPYVLLLNNDTVMPENFLGEMITAMEKSHKIAMVQPKILSIQDNSLFDYSGAAGGEMDIFAYPFARGRLFDNIEKDVGQYDEMESTVFWTSGCALLIRRNALDEIGLLDEDFFAHQEEIDLNWRSQLAGFKNVVTCKTHIYHYSGYTLKSDNERKMYLNHRNNLIMMLKNYSLSRLVIYFPLRVLFELATVFIDTLLWGGKRAKSVIKALIFVFTNPLFIFNKRRKIQKLRKVPDKEITKNMYSGSIVWDNYVRRSSAYQCISRFRSLNRKN